MGAENSSKWAVVTPGTGKSLCMGLEAGESLLGSVRGAQGVQRSGAEGHELEGKAGDDAPCGSRQALLPSFHFHLVISAE